MLYKLFLELPDLPRSLFTSSFLSNFKLLLTVLLTNILLLIFPSLPSFLISFTVGCCNNFYEDYLSPYCSNFNLFTDMLFLCKDMLFLPCGILFLFCDTLFLLFPIPLFLAFNWLSVRNSSFTFLQL